MRVEGSQSTTRNTLAIEYEPQYIQAQSVAHVPTLSINGVLKQTSSLEGDLEGCTIELFNLTGFLAYNSLSIPMRLFLNCGYGVPGDYGIPVQLVFELTRSQLHYLEHERLKSGPKGNMLFTVQLKGKVLVHSTPDNDAGSIRFRDIVTVTTPSVPSVRIPRSDWLDTILPGLGYDETLLIELPLPQYHAGSAQIAAAVQKLEIARQHLCDEQYREAVQLCRQAKDALTDRNASALMDSLEPFIGPKKAKTVDDILRAFGSLYTASSHPNPSTLPAEDRIEFTRDDAELAVNALTFVLRYVVQTLHTQSITTA